MPRERTQLPHLTFRLTAEPPFWCEFPSAVYHVTIVPCLAAGRYELTAYDRARAAEAILASYHSPEKLRAALYEHGFPVRTDTLAATIMRKLVGDGRAARVIHTQAT